MSIIRALQRIAVAVAFVSAGSQAACGQGESAAARSFVREFYDWYVPIVLKDHTGPASDVALKDKASLFEPTLLRALREDAAAQAKATEIVGLDYDPFVDSQDPCEHYEVGPVRAIGQHYFVDIFAVCSGKHSAKPDVVAEVARQKGVWVFVNFRDPKHHTDLRTELAHLRASRQEP